MAEKLFTLGEGIRVRKDDVKDHTWSFDTRLRSKIATAGKFRTIGDLEEDTGLEFYFEGGLTHQWFSMTPDGYFLNSYTEAGTEDSVSLFGAFDTLETTIQVKCEGDLYYFRLGTNDVDRCPVDEELNTRDKKFGLVVGTNLSQSHFSYVSKSLEDLEYLYPKLLPSTISFRNNGSYTPGGINKDGEVEGDWLASPSSGYLEGYLQERPVGLMTLPDKTRSLLIRSNTTELNNIITDSSPSAHIPVDVGNSYHVIQDPLFGTSSLSLSGLKFPTHSDFDLVGRKFEFIFHSKLELFEDRSLLIQKKGSYEIYTLRENGENYLCFDSVKDVSVPGNMWWEGHKTNISQYNTIPYSSYFLDGTNQGSVDTPYTLQFVASTGLDSNQPIFRQKSTSSNDGDVHVLIDKVGGMKWKNGKTGAFAESTGSISLEPDTFYHFALIFDGTTTSAYVNGVLIGSSTDKVSALNLGDIEIGHAWTGSNNNTEVSLTSARIAWISLDKGIAKWIGTFNPPASPVLESQTALLVNVNKPSGNIVDETPHAHQITKTNGGLIVGYAKTNLVKGKIPVLSLGRWSEYRVRRDPGSGVSVYCDCVDVTISNSDPMNWKNTLEPLVFVPSLHQSQIFEDVSLYLDDFAPLESKLKKLNRPSNRRSVSDVTSHYDLNDISTELQTASLTVSSADVSFPETNLIDDDPSSYWRGTTTNRPIVNNLNCNTISIDFNGRIDVDTLKLKIDGVNPEYNPKRIVVRGILNNNETKYADYDTLVWDDNSETLSLSPVVPNKTTGEMGQRINPVVGKFVENNKQYISVICGTPTYHFGKLDLSDSKWIVNNDISHNRYGARGISYTKKSNQKVIGIWSGNTTDTNYYEMDSSTGTLTLISTSGNTPAAKVHYCVGHYVNDATDNIMIVFGGYNGSAYTSLVSELNLETGVWSTLTVSGSAPSIRAQATSCMYKNASNQNCMLIFGGTNGSVWYNDLYELNLSTLTWTLLAPSGTPPIAREGAPSNLVYKDTSGHNIFVVYSGLNGTTKLSDFNEYNITTNSWSGVITLTGNNPPGCRSSEGVLFNDEDQKLCMMTFGGNNDAGYYNDRGGYCFYHPVLNVTDRVWKDKTPIASDCPTGSELLEITYKNHEYLAWMDKGRYLYGLELSTGAIFEFNTSIYQKPWNTNFVDHFSIALGTNKIGVFGGYIGGLSASPTRNFFEISLSDLTVNEVSMSGALPTSRAKAVFCYFKNKIGDEYALVYGGYDESGFGILTYTKINASGVCSLQTISADGGKLFSELFKKGLIYYKNTVPHLFLYQYTSDSLNYQDINLFTMSSSSGRMSSSDSSLIRTNDLGTLFGDKVIFFDSNSNPQVFKELDLTTMVLKKLTIGGILDSLNYRIGTAGSRIRFISKETGHKHYYELKDGVLTDIMQMITDRTVHEKLKIEVYYTDSLVDLNEIMIFTSNELYPFLQVDPSNDPKDDLSSITGLIHNNIRSVTFSPAFCGITDVDSAIQNTGMGVIPPQSDNGIVVIDNTGHPSRRVLVRVNVSEWLNQAYELLDTNNNVIEYGFVGDSRDISGVPSDIIIFWRELKGNKVEYVKVGADVPSSFLTYSDVYDVSTFKGPTDDLVEKLDVLSYSPSCTIVNGSISDAIIVPVSNQIEVNYAIGVQPNFVMMECQTSYKTKIQVEGYNGLGWDQLGYLDKKSATFVMGRIFPTTTYQKFRFTFLSTKFVGISISGLDLFNLHNGALNPSSQLIRCSKNKFWEITSSTSETVINYDQPLPCVCTDVVNVTNSPDMHLMLPPVQGKLLFIPVIDTPSAYPYYASIMTNVQSRLDANVVKINSVGVLASNDARIAFSFDNRVTWVGWSGSWNVVDASTPSQLSSTGMTPAEVRSIPSSAWTNYIGAGKYIDVAVSLQALDADSFCYYDNITFVVDSQNSSSRLVTYEPDKNFFSELTNSKVSFRKHAEISIDGDYTRLACGNLPTGVCDDNIQIWIPDSDGFLSKITGNSFELNPGWIYLNPGKPLISEYAGYGWFEERQTVRQINLTTSTISELKEGTYNGNSEGGISCSNGRNGYIFGIDNSVGNIGFLDKLDFSTGTLVRNSASLTPIYSRGCCSDLNGTLIPPMDGLTNYKYFDFSTDTRITETRTSGRSSGWNDQGSLSNTNKGTFFNYNSPLASYAYDFTTSVEEISYRQSYAGMKAVKGFSSSSMDQGLLLASSETASERLRLIRLDYANDTVYEEHNSMLPLTSTLYNTSSTDRDSCHSKVADNERGLIYIYSNQSKSLCLEMNFALKVFTNTSRLGETIATGREGYKAAGMSGLGYII